MNYLFKNTKLNTINKITPNVMSKPLLASTICFLSSSDKCAALIVRKIIPITRAKDAIDKDGNDP